MEWLSEVFIFIYIDHGYGKLLRQVAVRFGKDVVGKKVPIFSIKQLFAIGRRAWHRGKGGLVKFLQKQGLLACSHIDQVIIEVGLTVEVIVQFVGLWI